MKDLIKKILDYLFWGKTLKTDSLSRMFHKKTNAFVNLPTNRYESIIADNFKSQNEKSFMDEYIYIHEGYCIIDPDFGWAISNGRVISHSCNNPKTALPSISRYLSFKITKKKISHYNEIITWRQHAENNFFHFFSDILTKIWLLDEYEIDINGIPILISESLYNTSYFQFLLKNTRLKEFQFVIHKPEEYISTQRLIIAHPRFIKNKFLLKNRELINELKITPKKDSYIYIYRKKIVPRSQDNLENIISELEKKGITCVNFDDISFDEQLSWVVNARLLICDHGAAITNIMFHNDFSKLTLIELMPINRICTEFYWMCSELGISHFVFLTSSLNSESKTSLDINNFLIFLEKIHVKD